MSAHDRQHVASQCANPLLPPAGDLIRVGSRRWFLQTGVAGLAGLSLADTLRLQAATATNAALSAQGTSALRRRSRRP